MSARAVVTSDFDAVLRRSFEDFNRGDLDAFLEPMAPDGVVVPADSFPEGGPFRGHDEIRDFYSKLRDAWAPAPTVIVGETEVAGDKLFASFEWRGTGGASGIVTSSEWYLVNTFRDGMVVRVEFFTDLDAARSAAGLR